MTRDPCPQHPPTSRNPGATCAEQAQSTLEFLGALPVLLLAATCCLQALLLALGIVFAQSSVDRAAQGAPRSQVLAVVPPGWRSHARIERRGRQVEVRLRAPVVVPGAGRWLVVAARSEAAS